jgi:hypothetical protein
MRIISLGASSLLILTLVSSACSKRESAGDAAGTRAGAPATPAPGAASGHAAEGVKPGSYEDWCGEHEVPESLCTRCNPNLVAAFKATGDWCAEHGLPESQCRACNPNLKIERPPKPEGGD